MKVAKQESYIENKQIQADKKRQKIKALQHKMLGGDEPTINPMNYQLTLIQALNYYNIYSSDTDKKAWALSTVTDKLRRGIWSKIDECYFKQIGVLCRLQSRNQYLDPMEISFIEKKSSELDLMVKEVLPASTKVVVSIQERIKNVALDFASELDGELDDFIKQGYPKSFVFKNNVKSLSGKAAKVVSSFYQNQIMELEEVLIGDCPQLKESYSHIKPIHIKRYLKLLTDLTASCAELSIRKPKPTKVIIKKAKK